MSDEDEYTISDEYVWLEIAKSAVASRVGTKLELVSDPDAKRYSSSGNAYIADLADHMLLEFRRRFNPIPAEASSTDTQTLPDPPDPGADADPKTLS
jgi:hypothetical protein